MYHIVDPQGYMCITRFYVVSLKTAGLTFEPLSLTLLLTFCTQCMCHLHDYNAHGIKFYYCVLFTSFSNNSG
jgi:hypothetical protein